MSQPSKPRSSFSSFPVARLGAALALLSWATQREERREGPVPSELPEDVVPIWATDVTADGGAPPAGGRKVPLEPMKGQKTPPCGDPLIVVLGGGCWVELSARAPCGPNFWEHGGKCYLPMQKAAPVPTSIGM